KAVGFSAEGKSVQAVDSTGQLKRWDAATFKEQAALTLKTTVFDQAAFTPDGNTLYTTRGITGSGDVSTLSGKVEVWDVAKGKLVKTLTPHSEMTMQLLFDTKGTTLVTFGTDMRGSSQGGVFIGSSGETIKVWDVAEGKARAAFPVNLVSKIGL